MLIKDGTRIKFMDTAKIAFIRADGDYVHVHAANGERTMARDRIGNVERRIGGSQFVRISKSALVNVSYIKEMRSRRRGNYEFLLQSGEQLASGPTYRETVKKLLDWLK
jgi:two-component system LytT family response regulator